MRARSSSSRVMVGRDADLEALRAVFAEVEHALPRIALIAGEAGIGKSRLVAEFLDAVGQRSLVLTGQCVDFGGTAVPFAPIVTVLRDLVDAEGAEAVLDAAGGGRDALAGLLDAATTDARRDAYGAARLHEVVARLLERFSAERPLVVVIEDLHWGDRETLDVLRFVSRVVTEGAVLTILTYRTEDVPRGHPLRSFLADLERNRRVSRFELSRLSRDEVREQARQILGDAPSAARIAVLHERSEGVPFFVEELLSGAMEDGTAAVPDTLRHALLLRYESLDEGAQRLVRLLAAAGSRVEHDLLLTVSERTEEELERDLRVAVDAGLVVVDGSGYAFRHALVREAIDAELLPGERRSVHARYARALSGHPHRPEFAGQAVLVSSHWLAAHDLEEAFAASIVALRLSEGALAYTSAATMGERALELWDRVADPVATAGLDHVDLLFRTARAWNNVGDDRRALPTVDLALQETGPGDPERYARLLRLKATLKVMSGRSPISLLEEALSLVPPGRNPRLRTGILAELAAQYMVTGSSDRAIARATEALQEGCTEDARRYSSIAANVRGCSRIHTLDIEGGRRDLDHALELAGSDTFALLRYHVNASDAFFLLGDFVRSVETARKGLERAREAGVERSTGAILGVNAVDPLFALGDWDRADELIERSLDLDAPHVFNVYLRRAKMRSMHWRGDPDGAWQLYQEWRSSFAELGEQEPQIREGTAFDVGEIALSRGDLDTAWRCAEELLGGKPFASPGYELPLAAMAARALARRREEAHGDPDGSFVEDEGRILQVVEAVRAWPTHPFWSAVVDAELSGAAGTGDDPDAWHRAARASAGFGVPALARAYVRYGLGVACLSAGDRPGAAEALTQAQTQAAALGAGLLAGWSRDLLQVAGLATAATSPGDLTARERQVLDLIADGLTNAEIGRRLFISGKTVSVHVSAILRKLGATSRTDAARISRLRG